MVASLPLMMPQTPEQALMQLQRFFPLIDWSNLALIHLKVKDGTELLALPKPIMEQLLSQVVSLCAVLSHDGPAH